MWQSLCQTVDQAAINVMMVLGVPRLHGCGVIPRGGRISPHRSHHQPVYEPQDQVVPGMQAARYHGESSAHNTPASRWMTKPKIAPLVE